MLKKTFFLVLVCIISCFNLVYGEQQSNANTVVLTFNLANYNDHPFWSERLNLIVDAIEDAKADVVVLQEVRFDPDHPSSKEDYENMAEQILRKLHERGDFLNAELVSQPAMYYPYNKKNTRYYPLPASLSTEKRSLMWEGLSIISKFKITETGSYFLNPPAGCNDTNKRITQYVKIETKSQPLYIANIHFGLGSTCVETNVKETLANLQRVLSDQPVLVMGDFNITPDNPILNQFNEMGMIDIWKKLHPEENGFTFPSHQPAKRIDYIWANALMANRLINTRQIWLIGMNTKGGLYPSDHLGLALTF